MSKYNRANEVLVSVSMPLVFWTGEPLRERLADAVERLLPICTSKPIPGLLPPGAEELVTNIAAQLVSFGSPEAYCASLSEQALTELEGDLLQIHKLVTEAHQASKA